MAAYPIINSKCISCNKESTLRCKTCTEVLYCSSACQGSGQDLHKPLCKQAAKFHIVNPKLDPDCFRVIILHAQENKVKFAWAFEKDACLEVVHPVLCSFKLQQDADASDRDGSVVDATEGERPDLLNVHVRHFKLARFLGHCVLLWTPCGR